MKKRLPIILGIIAGFALSIATAVFVPIAVNNSKKQEQENRSSVLTSASEDLSYIEDFDFSDGADYAPPPSALIFYYEYKNGSSYFDCSYKIIPMVSDGRIHCLYVDKVTHERVENCLSTLTSVDSVSDLMGIPWRGITAYTKIKNEARHSGNWDLYNRPLMELILENGEDRIEEVIGEYYLLDVIKLFDASDFNRAFVEIVPYTISDGYAHLNRNGLLDNHLKYWRTFWFAAGMEAFYSFFSVEFITTQEILGNRIFTIDGVEVMNVELLYYIKTIEEKPYFYHDLEEEEFVIKKEFVRTSDNGDTFNLTIDVTKYLKFIETN